MTEEEKEYCNSKIYNFRTIFTFNLKEFKYETTTKVITYFLILMNFSKKKILEFG
jgi:hypothetical protein